MKTKPSSIEEIRQRTRNLIENHERSIRQFHENHFPHLCGRKVISDSAIMREAAAEIDRLRDENARLREALRPFATAANSNIDSNLSLLHAICSLTIDDFGRARDAIREGGRND